MQGLKVWMGINSLLIIGLFVILYLVIRQVGILVNYHGPVGARESQKGPRVGENIAHFTKRFLDQPITSPTLVVFGSSSCAICESVKKAVHQLYEFWHKKASFFLVYEEQKHGQAREGLADKMWLFHNDDFRKALEVTVLPFAVMIDEDGTVLGGGLVNNISNVESLLERLSA